MAAQDPGPCLAKEKLPVQGSIWAETGPPCAGGKFLLWRGDSLFPQKILKYYELLPLR